MKLGSVSEALQQNVFTYTKAWDIVPRSKMQKHKR